MHFTYSQIQSPTDLMQGDVLKRTPAINSLLKEVHPHFYHNDKNLYFMVLTQSCDLVSRSVGGCKAAYITIAPVRGMEDILHRQVESHQLYDSNFASLPILTDKAKTKLSEFLQRLYNNNEPGYFFLETQGTELLNDCCAVLNLSIAIKAEKHLQKCLDAKFLELDPAFQAKLGWLVGQMYSRVGTRDWLPSDVTNKIQAILKDAAIWIPNEKLKALKESFTEFRNANPNKAITQLDVNNIIRKLPTKKKQVMDRTSTILKDVLGDNDDEQRNLAEKLRRRLENDLALNQLLS